MPGLPDLGQERLQRLDLLAELGGRAAGQRHLVPHQRGGGGERLGRQPRRLGVVHVGDDQHGRRVLVEAVGHLVEGEPGVLEADLLADDVEGQRRQAAVHLAHDAGEHRAVAHAGVEHAHRRRLGVQVGELQADAARHHLLLAAGVDEQQILLAVVEEAEVARGRALARRPISPPGAASPPTRSSCISSRGATGASTPWLVRKALTRSSVSGVMRAPSRRRETNLPSLTARRPNVEFGHAGAPAEFRNAVQQIRRLRGPSPQLLGRRPSTILFRSQKSYRSERWDSNHK